MSFQFPKRQILQTIDRSKILEQNIKQLMSEDLKEEGVAT